MHMRSVEVERSGGQITHVSSHFYDLRQLGREVVEETKRSKEILDFDKDGSLSFEVVTEAEIIVYEASTITLPRGEKVRLSRKKYSPDKILQSKETATLLSPDSVSLDRQPHVTFSAVGAALGQDETHLATSPHALLSTHDLFTDFAIASKWKLNLTSIKIK